MALRPIVLWAVLIVAQNLNIAVGDEGYCYEKGKKCSPENWPGKCQDKKGQSPIDIPITDDSFSNPTKAIFYLSKGCSKLQKFTAKNIDDQVVVELEGEPCFITVGTVEKKITYVCKGIDFHWGSSRSDGSEHTVNGNKRTMEANINCYNKKFTNFPDALKSGQPGDVAIFSVHYFSYYMSNNQGYKPIVACLKDIGSDGMSIQGSSLNVSNFLNVDDNGGIFEMIYYEDGSLTHPWLGDCFGKVGRFAVHRTIIMKTDSLEEFYKLKGRNGEPIRKNSRDVQRSDGIKFEYLRARPEIEKEESQVSGHRPGLFHRLPLIHKF